MDSLALIRLQEPLSKGDNIQKLLLLHVKAYSWQTKESINISFLKDLNQKGIFLEWIGMLKGLKRPLHTVAVNPSNHFQANFKNEEGRVFPIAVKKLYFTQEQTLQMQDENFRRLIKAHALHTNFQGTVEEFEFYCKTLFNVDIRVLKANDFNLFFLVANTDSLNIDFSEMKRLLPKRTQTEQSFLISQKVGFEVSFLEEKKVLSFGSTKRATLYFRKD